MVDFQEKIEKAGLVAGCVIEENGKYLLVQQNGGSGANLWNLPAGYVDKGETLEQAAIRETKEETGLLVKLLGQLGVWHTTATESVKHAYRSEIQSGELAVPQDEIKEARWFSYDEILALQDQNLLRANWVFEALTLAQRVK